MARVLVVDDDLRLRRLVRLYLEKDGHHVLEAGDGESALAIDRELYDLVILDIMLGEMDGWTVCRRLRERGNTPILMLTALGRVDDRVAGLRMGADDYLVKPFAHPELVARIEALLRRSAVAPAPESGEAQERRSLWHVGDLVVDTVAERVWCGDREVSLTAKEYDLLWLLAQHPNQLFTRDQILDRVWGWEFEGTQRAVDTHVKNLREKLGPWGAVIKTVWGRGYRFEGSP